jgi:hypothetical protein
MALIQWTENPVSNAQISIPHKPLNLVKEKKDETVTDFY